MSSHLNSLRLRDYVPNLGPHPCHQDCILGDMSPSSSDRRLCNQAIGALTRVAGSLTDELPRTAPVGACLSAYESTTSSAQPWIEHIHHTGAESCTAQHEDA